MNAPQRVLVTGGAGYIGSLLTPLLLQQGYAVRVLDNARWGAESLLGVYYHPAFEFLHADLRDEAAVRAAVANVDAIVHLAAIVGDPACSKEPALATQINYEAAANLYRRAAEAGVQRFLFASTCSNYGKMSDPQAVCTEVSELRPVSLYAELKVKFEHYLLGRSDVPCATALRFSTAYGLSPRMRFDLTVNEFVRDAALSKEIVIYGEQFWRPYCHTLDLSRACMHMLSADPALINRQAFNVGDSGENYQKKMLIEAIAEQIPTVQYRTVQKTEDPRDYRVGFAKIQELGFRIQQRVPDGIREIARVVKDKLILEPYSTRHANV